MPGTANSKRNPNMAHMTKCQAELEHLENIATNVVGIMFGMNSTWSLLRNGLVDSVLNS